MFAPTKGIRKLKDHNFEAEIIYWIKKKPEEKTLSPQLNEHAPP